MLKKILIALLIVVAGFAVVVALQPSEFRIARSAVIAAPASAVFQQCLFINMDKMVGGDFERGLAQMKQVAEALGR